MMKTSQKQDEERLWTFAVVFKARSRNLLIELEDFLLSRGGFVVYKTGPTPYHLFVIKARDKPEEGQNDEREG
jgi:hypothetical protein